VTYLTYLASQPNEFAHQTTFQSVFVQLVYPRNPSNFSILYIYLVRVASFLRYPPVPNSLCDFGHSRSLQRHADDYVAQTRYDLQVVLGLLAYCELLHFTLSYLLVAEVRRYQNTISSTDFYMSNTLMLPLHWQCKCVL